MRTCREYTAQPCRIRATVVGIFSSSCRAAMRRRRYEASISRPYHVHHIHPRSSPRRTLGALIQETGVETPPSKFIQERLIVLSGQMSSADEDLSSLAHTSSPARLGMELRNLDPTYLDILVSILRRAPHEAPKYPMTRFEMETSADELHILIRFSASSGPI